jgi:murein DD-endopeptidase MepM/ murein hydrolase activator NlpD
MSFKKSEILKQYFQDRPESISAILDFDKPSDRLFPFDFTSNNKGLDSQQFSDTASFSQWISSTLAENNCRYGIGGYNEHRIIYSRSKLFDAVEEPRRLHLGVDIWGPEGTNVFSPIDGVIHSFNFNDNFGDYGATLILEHQINELKFYSLYGHLSLKSISNLKKGSSLRKGDKIAEFGNTLENGHWPPHLHFQLIFDMRNMEGDFPGVCRYSDRETYLNNCPDPEIILKYTFR